MSQENYNNNAFSPENFHMVLLIQMMRTYDILLALLAVQDPIKATQLVELHEAGKTFTPHPAFAVEEDA